MERRPRVHYPGWLYHVIARGNRGHKVFRRAQDYRVYLKFLEEYQERSSGGSLQYEPESGGRMGTDKNSETRLQELEGAITKGRRQKIRN
jgi:hypothetical protein